MDVMWMVRGAVGGVLIGVAASLVLALSGRVMGVSGIVNGLLAKTSANELAWRGLFLVGLVLGGIVASLAMGRPADLAMPSLGLAALAGVLVGVGTRLGNGCTSGHGVCGLSRMSPRSLVATLTFIGTGAMAVFVVRMMGGAS